MNSSTPMKDSGIDWLGVVPSHWEKRRLKLAVTLVNEKIEATDLDVKYVGLEHIQSWTGKLDLDDEASSEGTANAFIEGDVLFGKLRPYLAKVHLAEISGICSGEALVLRSQEKLLPTYLKYFLLSKPTIENINSSTYGSKMPRASWEFIGGQLQLLPPKEEQSAIANFLDEKTAHINALIEKKRKLLEFLAENRAAIITNAVTKGINPDAPMKDSGIDWLGVVPSHWEKRRLKLAVTLVNEKIEATDLDVKYVGLEHIQSWTGKLDLDDEASSEGTANAFIEGDVLFGKLRPYLAKVHLAEISGICSGEALVLRSQEKLLPTYLKYFLLSKSTIENINSSTYGSKMPRASWEFIGGQLQLLPPKEEQAAITNFLDKKTTHIDALIEKNRKLLELFTEYRSALITNAVTGKIKVV